MVVATVIAILATLSAAGLAATRQRVRADKTRNTIRKLHEIIVGHHESYLRRRVPFIASATDHRANGLAKLEAVRRLMVYEMPDCWADVAASTAAVSSLPSPDAILAELDGLMIRLGHNLHITEDPNYAPRSPKGGRSKRKTKRKSRISPK
jgi:hypothetical protein